MNRNLIHGLALATAVAGGILLGRMTTEPAPPGEPSAAGGDREILYWVAPMDPNYRREEPGKSPMGMDLVPVYADEVGDAPGVVALDPVVVNNLGVRTAVAESGSLPRVIDTVGYVTYDEETIQHVHVRVDGWIERLSINAEGDPVEQGQLLFELYSPVLVNAQQEYLAAVKSGNAALRTASRERLAALGVSAAEITRIEQERTVSQRVQYLAEADGVVADLGVREGMYVTPATDVLSIASLDSVWVIAEVFQRQAAWVERGQPARVTLDFRPGAELAGEIDYVYPELDPGSRTLRARIRFDNENRALRPNMFARVRIDGADTGPIVHVPRAAVVRGGDVNRIVIDIGGGRFRSQPVIVGVESGDRVAIRSGIDAGERVVVSGQFLIDSESNIGTALERLSPAESVSEHDHGAM